MNGLEHILIFIILILIIIVLSFWRKINYINKVLDEVIQGNLNQRVRLQNHIRPLSRLNIKINNIIGKFQKTYENNKVSEESRKKMISNISHDLRTPLTSMLGYMELIIGDNTLSNEENMKYLKIVYSKGLNLYDLMEEFFQISKLDSNDIKLEIKEVNISEIIRQNIISFFGEIKKLNIEMKISIPEEDIYILGDEKVLNRILSNLINNAVKHGARATLIGVELNYNKENIFVDVYDNGVGIPKDDIDYIFDRLYTVEKSRKLNIKSSGLGLTIVKKLVKSLGGTISVSSIPFKRTAFTFTIPRSYSKSNK